MEPLDPALVEGLGRPEAHPDDPSAASGVEALQTHISHVFLTGERVYKLRKAVALSFLSFATRAERNADALREVALNRRLAPDVYLGVAPVEAGPGGVRVGPVGERLRQGEGGATPEHCVVMRRLPEGRDALSLLRAGRLRPEDLDAVAERLARFHAEVGLGAPAPYSPEAWWERSEAPVRANFAALRERPPPGWDAAAVDALAERARARLAAAAERLEARRREGRAVEGHGDVHLQHVWLEEEGAPPLLIDCIEFDAELRRVDAASEVAFLAMDLRYRGAPGLAERFLRRYAAAADDYGLYAVVDDYASYRAAVRAKVAALAADEPEVDAAQRDAARESAARHLALADALLRPPGPGAVAVVAGTVGAGKSTLAERLADAAGGALVATDPTRKRLAGLAPSERASAPPGRGLYSRARSDAVYAGLLERAAPVLDSGRPVVLDGTYASRARRDAVRAFAERRGAACLLVEARCAEAVARERLAARAARGDAVSDAGPELLERSRAAFEPPEEWPEASRHAVDTDAEDWAERAGALGATLARCADRRQQPPGAARRGAEEE